ncbi:MAG: AI-2E family transporter [Bryocella sp.]
MPTSGTVGRDRLKVRRYILFTIAVLLSLALAWELRGVLEIVYISALFAVVLMPLVQRIMQMKIYKYHPSRPVAILGLLGVVFVALIGFFLIGLPPVIHDMQSFAQDLPARLPGLILKLKRLPMADKIGVDNVAARAETMLSGLAGYLLASFPSWMARIFDLAMAFILCVYFMLEGDVAYEYFLSFFREDTRERLAKTLLVAEQRMSKWLIGQGLLMLILGVVSTIAFALLHVRYFFLLGVLMGLFNIIPVVGGIITIALAAVVAALDSWSKMAAVLIFYGIYTQIENAYLTPLIMKTSVNLMALSVLIALLCGTTLAGVLGALVAVPTAALVAVLMDEYMVKQRTEPAKETLEGKG